MEQTFLQDAILHMTIASYIHPEKKANVQIARMAKRYTHLTKSKLDLRVLRRVIKCTKPSLLIKLSYDELTKETGEYK